MDTNMDTLVSRLARRGASDDSCGWSGSVGLLGRRVDFCPDAWLGRWTAQPAGLVDQVRSIRLQRCGGRHLGR